MAMPVVTIVSQATRLYGILGEQGVEDAVGDLVGQLVGMAHADRFAGEQKLALCHGISPALVMIAADTRLRTS